jgi:hypothetical protein
VPYLSEAQPMPLPALPNVMELGAYGVLLLGVVYGFYKGVPAVARFVAAWLDNLLKNQAAALQLILDDSKETRRVFEETMAQESIDRVAERATWAARADEAQRKIIEILQERRG